MHSTVLFTSLLFSLNTCAPPVNSGESRMKNEENAQIQEVPYGKTVTLMCLSNDANHNFFFWELATNDVIGPGNPLNRFKYNYEVLSGNLTIRSVSQEEEGLYSCVSRGVRNDHINRRTIRLVVEKDWEDVWEHDSGVNLFRITIILIFLFILCGGIFVAYRLWKNRYVSPSYLDPSDDEDSAEELFATPGTSRDTANIIIDRTKDGISTDFGSILDAANKD